MTNARTIIAAAISIMLGSTACSSEITAKPWYPNAKKARSDAATREPKDAADGDGGRDSDDEDHGDTDAGH